MLDIGISGYTNSRIRCNAELRGYTGYAELKAASSYDMFLNLSTTRTDAGWMYFKTNNDDYIQLSGSDNKVNIYKDTARGNLEVTGRILIDGSHLYEQPKSSTSSTTLVLDQSMSSEFGSDSHGINIYGRQCGNSHLKFHNSKSDSVCNVLTDGNLDVGKVLTLKRIPAVSDTTPLVIINESAGGATGAIFQSTASGQGSLINYTTAQGAVGWTEGVDWGSLNEFIIKSGSNGLTSQSNGDTTISGTLGVQKLSITNTSARPTEINNMMHNGPYLVATSQIHSNNKLLFALRCRPLNQLWCFGVAASNQYIISHENSTKSNIQPNGNTPISGNLDAGPSQAQTSVKAYVNHAGHRGNVEIKAMWNSQGYGNFNTTNADGLLPTATKDALYLYCGLNFIYFYKPITNASDDRLKGNEELIENACET